MFKYLAVIVTYNRVEKLKREVNSLLLQTVRPSKIIVVDNDSSDNTYDYMTALARDNSKIVYKKMNKNCGGAGGFYEGIALAKRFNVDWIALADDDAIYDKEFFKNIALASQKNNDVFCFTGSVRYLTGEIQLDHRRQAREKIFVHQNNVPIECYQRNFYLQAFSFVGVVINKHMVDKVGLPEREYFIWCDDTEYSLRVNKYTPILNVSAANVYHDTKKNSNNKHQRYIPNWKYYYGLRNSILMNKKHSKHPIIYKILLFFLEIKKIVTPLVKYRYYHPYIFKTMIMYHKAFHDGEKSISGINSQFLPKK